MGLPLRMDNTLVQSTGRPYNGSPPPTLRERSKGKDRTSEKVKYIHVHVTTTTQLNSTQDRS